MFSGTFRDWTRKLKQWLGEELANAQKLSFWQKIRHLKGLYELNFECNMDSWCLSFFLSILHLVMFDYDGSYKSHLKSFCGYILHLVSYQLEPLVFIVCLLAGSTLRKLCHSNPSQLYFDTGAWGMRLPLSTKRTFAFTKRSSGYITVVDWFTGINYYYKYEICLDDIFIYFWVIFAICFPSLLILFLLLYAKRTLVFRKTSGSGLISIYGNYFYIFL